MEEVNEGDDKPWSSLSYSEKFSCVIKNITVEPILSCYIIPSIIANLAIQNLMLEKACRVNLGYSDDICDRISLRNQTDISDEERETQRLVAGMNSWKAILQSSLPAIFILFLGSFSDKTGRRKPFMLMPIFGELLVTIGFLLCTYYYLEWPMEVAGVIEGLFRALTGGWTIMFMAVFSYLGDVTSVEMRTVRFGMVNVCASLGTLIGNPLSGIVYKKFGFYGVFHITAVLYGIGLIYGLVRLKEAKKPEPLSKSCCRTFLDPQHVVQTFGVAFKPREKNLRLRMLLTIVLSVTLTGPIQGEIGVGYPFVRIRFNWDEIDYSIFSTYVTVINLFGTSIAMGLFVHVMKMDDTILGAIACLSKIIASCFYAFVKTPTSFYIVTLLEMIGGTSLIAMRSIASKLVPADELGKLYSLFGFCDAIVPIIYQPMYNTFYSKTIYTLPGAFFLLGAALTLPALIIFLYLYHLQKNDLPIQVDETPTTDNKSTRLEEQ